MTVRDLIAHLQTFPPEMPVAHQMCSSMHPLKMTDIEVIELADAGGFMYKAAEADLYRHMDGKPRQSWLCFPGN